MDKGAADLRGLLTGCRCEQCTDDPAPTWTEAWRLECEARAVLKMPTREARRDYLASIEKLRGAPGRQRLEAAIMGAHKAKKEGQDRAAPP